MSTLLETPVLPGLTLVEEGTVTTLAETRMLQAITEGVLGPQGPAGPPGDVSLSNTNLWTATNQFRGPVIMGREWLDPRDTRFSGGAACDNSTDDTASWQALLDHIGATDVMRTAEIYVPGWSVISSRLNTHMKTLHMRGRGWGSVRTGTQPSSGFRSSGAIPTTDAMMRLGGSTGSMLEGFQFLGHATTMPLAGLEIHREAAAPLTNTMNRLDRMWFGRLIGYEAGQTLQNGILTAGLDENNDATTVDQCRFYECGNGFDGSTQGGTGLQSVGWHFVDSRFDYCEFNIITKAQLMATNCFSANSKQADIKQLGGRVRLTNWYSELGKRLAELQGSSKLIVRDGYFQLSDGNIHTDQRVITQTTDHYVEIDLEDFDLRAGVYTGSPILIRTSTPAVGPIAHRAIRLSKVTYINQRITPAMLDLQRTASAHQITLWGENQETPDSSGRGKIVPFFNDLQGASSVIDFARMDAKKTVPGTARQTHTVSGAVTFNADLAAEVHRISLQANATSSSITGTPTEGQKLVIEWIQDATGSRTYAWPTNVRFAGGAAPTPTTLALKKDIVAFTWDANYSQWFEQYRAVRVGS